MSEQTAEPSTSPSDDQVADALEQGRELGSKYQQLVEDEVARVEAEAALAEQDPHDPVGCPLCGGSGQVPSMLPELLADAHDKHRCDKCNGIGMVRSGSLIPEHMVQACTACSGIGYVTELQPMVLPSPSVEIAATANAVPPPEPAPFVMPVVS